MLKEQNDEKCDAVMAAQRFVAGKQKNKISNFKLVILQHEQGNYK